jgi:ABC-type Zn uptake system ZnuABC Zn-binding protein ZnuA
VRAGLVVLAVAAAMTAATPARSALHVVATTTDVASLASAVGGDLVTVESIVPAATDPEAFESRPGDLDKVRRADLLVRVGLGYDYWLDALVTRIGDTRLMRGGAAYVDASAGVPLLEIRGQTVLNEGGHAHGVANPHYWLDPENAITITAGIAEALVRLLPEQRDRIVANRARFLAELGERRQRWVEQLKPFAGARLIAYHNSWPYFSRRFHLNVIDFIEPKPGIAASPAHLARMIADGRDAKVRAIVHEPYEPDDSSRLVARRLGVPVVVLAVSVDSLAGTKDYLSLFDYDCAALAQALAVHGPR